MQIIAAFENDDAGLVYLQEIMFMILNQEISSLFYKHLKYIKVYKIFYISMYGEKSLIYTSKC